MILWGVPIDALPVPINGKETVSMETLLSAPLKEQEKFQELFQLLDEKGLHEEKGQIMDLVNGPTVWEGAEGIKNGQAPCEKTGGTGV